MIQLHKSKDDLALVTDCSEESIFNGEVAELVAKLIESKSVVGDWKVFLGKLLPQVTEITNKMRGYKSRVLEKRLLASNYWFPSEDTFESVGRIDTASELWGGNGKGVDLSDPKVAAETKAALGKKGIREAVINGGTIEVSKI